MRETHSYSKTAVSVEARKLRLKQEPRLFGSADSNTFFGKGKE
jgi:hypothetical protein